MQRNRCDNRPSKKATTTPTPKAPLEFQEQEKKRGAHL